MLRSQWTWILYTKSRYASSFCQANLLDQPHSNQKLPFLPSHDPQQLAPSKNVPPSPPPFENFIKEEIFPSLQITTPKVTELPGKSKSKSWIIIIIYPYFLMVYAKLLTLMNFLPGKACMICQNMVEVKFYQLFHS